MKLPNKVIERYVSVSRREAKNERARNRDEQTCSNENEEEKSQLLNDQGDDDEIPGQTMNTFISDFRIVNEDEIVFVHGTFDQHVNQTYRCSTRPSRRERTRFTDRSDQRTGHGVGKNDAEDCRSPGVLHTETKGKLKCLERSSSQCSSEQHSSLTCRMTCRSAVDFAVTMM